MKLIIVRVKSCKVVIVGEERVIIMRIMVFEFIGGGGVGVI